MHGQDSEQNYLRAAGEPPVPSGGALDCADAGLCDGTVGIRRFRPEDRRALFESVRESVEEICAWMVWCRPDYSEKDSAEFIAGCAGDWKEGARYSFVIFDQHDGTLLGSVGLSGIHKTHRVAGLGYWVRTGRTGKGIASAAVRLAARFAFEQLGLQRVELVVPTENQASLRVAEKAGARLEGVMKDRIMLRGKSQNAAMYALVRRNVENPEIKGAFGGQ